MPPFSVILPAAGRSTRFGGDKLLAPLAGKPVLAHTLAAFLSRDDVASVVIPARFDGVEAAFPDAPASLRELLADRRVRVYTGGATRAESVRAGLRGVAAEVEWVAVHDAARPLVSRGLIERALTAAVLHGAAVPALPVSLTVKQADGPLPARVKRTVPRADLWAMQTPQVARRRDLLAACDAYEARGRPWDQVTDDAQLLEMAGHEVWLVEGEERNLKVTTALDLRLAEALVKGFSA